MFDTDLNVETTFIYLLLTELFPHRFVSQTRGAGAVNQREKNEDVYRPLQKRERTGKENGCFPFV